MSRHECLFEVNKYTVRSLQKKKKIISIASKIFKDKN